MEQVQKNNDEGKNVNSEDLKKEPNKIKESPKKEGFIYAESFINRDKSIVKIFYKDKFIGTGFFLKIIQVNTIMKMLVTSQKIIGSLEIEDYPIFKITFKDGEREIKLNNINRQIFSFSKEENILIIKILNEDKILDESFLELDENYDNTKTYFNNGIHIFGYTDGNELTFAFGTIKEISEENDYKFYHDICFTSGSPGYPIFLSSTFKIIGVHQGRNKKKTRGYGVFLGPIIQKINQLTKNGKNYNQNISKNKQTKQQIELTIKVEITDINKEIYFLGGDYDKKLKKFNSFYNELKDAKIELDGNEIPYTNSYKFNGAGEHKIKYEFDYYLTTCENMLNGCEKLIDIKFIDFNTDNITNMNKMFANCSELTSLDLSSFNNDNVVNMSNMFSSCENLLSINLSSFKTNNTSKMVGMFSWCINITSLDLSSFNTSKVESMSCMFLDCQNLSSLDLSCFNTNKLTNTYAMFYGCKNLITLDLSSFNTNNCTNMSEMFRFCYNLPKLDLFSFDTSNVTENGIKEMFDYCNSLKKIRFGKFCENIKEVYKFKKPIK